jgi:hypothetical protein
MATITYKYLPLGDPDVNSNQSRGLSLQMNGYAPATFKRNVLDYLEGVTEIPDLSRLLDICNGTLLFKDIEYVADGNGFAVSNSSEYSDAVKNPGSHMFQNIVVEAADEFKLTSQEEKVPHGSTVVQIPISDNMLGDRLVGQYVNVNAIVIYGQAYNIDFYSETQQGSIENVVPIGIVAFASNDALKIDKSGESVAKTIVKMTLTLSYRECDSVYTDQSYETWSKFAGAMHVVNNDLLTTSSFVIRDRQVIPMRDVEPSGQYAEQISSEDIVDFNSKVFFTNDIDGNNWDRNVDFGSPAKLTVLTKSVPENRGVRLPQTVIGKVEYSDKNGYTYGCLEGVHQSFYEYANGDVSGAVYENDWFSRNKPAINLFSDSYDYRFVDDRYAGPETSACFADGANILSKDSIVCGDSLSLNSSKVKVIGNSVVIGSHNVTGLTRPLSDSEKSAYPDRVKYDSFIANSETVKILNSTSGALNETTNPRLTILNSNNVIIDNRPSDTTVDTNLRSENAVIGSDNVTLTKTDRVIVLGCHGGLTNISRSENVTIIGTGENVVDGNIGDNHSFKVKDSVVLGKRNYISCSENEEGDWTESDLFMVGTDLQNDSEQNRNVSEEDRDPTIILGSRNQLYHQPSTRKRIVVGGGKHETKGIGEFKYNCYELSTVKETSLEKDLPNGTSSEPRTSQETANTLMDIKGRAIDYGSCGISLGSMAAVRSDDSYANYQFEPRGRINLFKLYALLERIYWVPQTIVGKNQKFVPNAGYLVYNSNIGRSGVGGYGDTPQGAEVLPGEVPWCSYAYSEEWESDGPDHIIPEYPRNEYSYDDRCGSTRLSDLVDDNISRYRYYPMTPKTEDQ